MRILQLVALKHDIPDANLRAGDVGTIVEMVKGKVVFVEFVEASGYTRALLELAADDIRSLEPDEILAARR